jgi:mannose-6-phosphate isomerase-like protein (cupin superfamily)
MSNTPRIALFCASAMAFVLAASNPLLAQGMMKEAASSAPAAGEATQTVIAENDKLKVIDIVEKPGETGPMATRLGLVFYVVSGGTFERTFGDGSKEVTPRKAGQTVLVKEKRPYSVKNVGKTTIHLIEVELK